MARADKGMGGGVAGGKAGPDGHQSPGDPDGKITKADLDSEIMGEFKQQGTDPNRLTNTRETQPGAAPEPDDNPAESARKLDKSVRAQEELGKGNRYGDAHAKNDPKAEKPLELEDPDKVVDDPIKMKGTSG